MLDEVEVLTLRVSHLVPFIDSVVRVVSRIRPALNTLSYLACFKVLPCFDFAIYGLFIFMVNWKEAHSEPCKTSDVEVFAKLVNNRKPLIFFTKKLRHRHLKRFWIRLSSMKSKLQGLLYIATIFPLEMPNVTGFLRL